MKIAFDCLGTLDGFNKAKVLALYRALQSRGHDMYVWSSEYSMAIRLNKELNLNGKPISKFGSRPWESEDGIEDDKMDIAIDDDASQTWLAAKYILLVRDIHGDIEELADRLIKMRTNAQELDNENS